MSDDNSFTKGVKGGAGAAVGAVAVAFGVGALCVLFPPLAIPAAKIAAIGIAASQGRDISGQLGG